MCGIIGLFNDPNAAQQLALGMQSIQNRGQDQYSIATEHSVKGARKLESLQEKLKKRQFVSNSAIGHCLHSVVSYCPQPFVGNGKLVANCEIYNWKTLAQKHMVKARNDAKLVFLLLERTESKHWPKLLTEFDGDFAFAYWKNNTVLLVRDTLGVKPVWFSLEKKRFGFASEAKALYATGFESATELNPRKGLLFDLKTQRSRFFKRPFFSLQTKTKQKELFDLTEFENRFLNAVRKRIPKQKFGILFSGGIDSVMLAKTCQKLGKKPTLFVAGIQTNPTELPKDITHAEQAARELKLPLVKTLVSTATAQNVLPTIVEIIESADPVKVGIALPLFFACQTARQKKFRVLFSGLGADGLLGGFFRQQESKNLNRDCVSYVLKAFETDLYRDDTISMRSAVELRVPYYDSEFVSYALRIPAEHKIGAGVTKKPLRELAVYWGISPALAFRPKKAMQYGSNADKLIEQLARKEKKNKGAFLEQFLHKPRMRLGALVSGGKDGWYAAFIQHQKNYAIECLIAIESKNPHSFMFHTPNIRLVKLQSKASGIPLVLQKTRGEKETELIDLKKAVQKAKKQFKLDGLVCGALESNYQRQRIERIADQCGLKVFSPLWQKNQLQELEELLQNQFEIVFSSIAAHGFDKSWLGKKLDSKTIAELDSLHKRFQINPAGEGGEFETLVLDCPLFKQKIRVKKAEVTMQNEFSGEWKIKTAELVIKS